jgi:hypothetical protein
VLLAAVVLLLLLLLLVVTWASCDKEDLGLDRCPPPNTCGCALPMKLYLLLSKPYAERQ